MKENSVPFLEKWFHTYVQGFYSADEQLQFHVRLKEEHTLRVVQQASAIARWLACSAEQVQLAEIAALLHDIGRFEQYKRYRTFNDARSINHAELGLAVLAKVNILSTAGLSAQQQESIKGAILYHNRRTIPATIDDGECALLSKITRDADKLDIFSMLITEDEDSKIPQSTELQQVIAYSAPIVDDLLQGRLVKPQEIKTSMDLMLFRLSWIYDLYFAYSFSYVLKQQYIEKIMATLPKTEDLRLVQQAVEQYAKSR